jgi:nucleotide-binding universal stress UspA family protein
MPSLARILLPTDFSERSAGAARYARTLAAHFGSELTLLHVLMPPQYEFGALDIGGSMLNELYRSQAGTAQREMESFLAAELAGLNVRRLVLEGDPARKIVEFAHHENIDMIVMPTHGYGPFRRFILGSNTAKVLHDADCPVWTGVHLEETPAGLGAPLASVLCAVDLGPQSSKTLFWAAMLAREFGARLTLAHSTAADPDVGDSSEVNWRVDVREAAEQELLRLQRFVGVEADLVVEAGEPAAVICSVAQRVGADVVVIGRGSAAGVFGRLRTNAYAIIRQSPCPAVSV